ncbi:pectinesterase family protein [Massilia timonae]|uniref:Pectate lyase n=1 Tax=Massilia timonae TaxID=47229 RepID=A0A1S2N6R3_9BURK|nr:pectinesterase family protein [Massilia timonae]OIJ40767.1 pectate lyase [Massilia timonae]
MSGARAVVATLLPAFALASLVPAIVFAAAPIPGPIAERQHAPADGWAAQQGGTRGGALASPAHVYTVADRAQLVAALEASAPARIVRVAATIDMSEGRPFRDHDDQARRGAVRLPSNTTLIGVAPGAGFVNASLLVAGVEQVIVRHLAIRNPCDVAPQWDPRDGAKGNWNSEFDGITVRDARHVWIDHNSFTDSPDTDDRAPVENGKRKQCHDGALDITQGSDLVSVTYNHFAQHEKNMLIGAGDRFTGDRGRLRITLKGNLFEHVAERAPRVRYGQVHLLNNYYVGERGRAVYGHGYSIGVAHASRLISDANAFDVAGASACSQLVRDPAHSPGVFVDTGSLLNGQPLDDCPHGGDAGWRVPYSYTALPASQVPAHVRANAGPRPGAGDAAGALVEARIAPSTGAPFVLRARRAANGDWQGASLQLVDGGKTLQVELLAARGGQVQRLKQIRRRTVPSGMPLVLGFAADADQLAALIDGERVTTALAEPLAATRPLDWEAGAHRLLDLRGGPFDAAPARLYAQVAVGRILLQAGDPAADVPIGGAARFAAVSADPRIASVAIAHGAVRVTPLTAGRTAVTMRSAGDPWAQASFDVVVGERFIAPRGATSVATHPRTGERGVPPDTPLRLALTPGAELTGEGSIRVLRKRDGLLVAVVRPGETVAAIGPAPRRRLVRQHDLRIVDGELRARLPQALEYDTEYEALAEARLVRGAAFHGARWRFRTTPHRPVGDSVTVAAEGRSHFRTVQGALDYAMSLPRAQALTVNVADGVYPELLYLRDKDNLTLRGASRESTVIRAANSDTLNPGSGAGQEAGAPGLLGGRALFLVQDSDLLDLRDIALHNSTLRTDGHSPQAETLFFSSRDGRLMARNAHFLSEQDTLQLTGYAWFHKSLVEGNVDFIWGNNRAALFEDSEIRSIGDSARPDSGGYIVQARTIGAAEPGFVFLRSRLTRGPGPAGNLPADGSAYLARSPGTANTWDNVAFIDCSVGPHIAADGWLRRPAPNPAAGGWREYGNRGPDGRARSYGGIMLDGEQAARLSTRAAVFAGRGWNPQP